MKRFTKANKGSGRLSSTNTLFSDIWFSGVKTMEDKNTEGIYYCRYVKTSHKGFCLAQLEKLLKEWPGGFYLFMNRSLIFPCNKSIMDIGYKYKSQKVLLFTAMKGSKNTEPGVTYLYRYPDKHYNNSIFSFLFTNIIGRYFSAYNTI